jgi:glycosyltransferase involved in cell wall biosynthesis
MARIIIIGKYPPIQGGVSTQTYWHAQELAKRGHTIHIITNASETEYGIRQFLWGKDFKLLNGNHVNGKVLVHSTTFLKTNSYIPWSNPFGSKLFGLTIKVIKKYGCDLIIGWYFEPYGLIASQVGKIFDIPVVIRHAGSDLGRLSKHPNLKVSYEWMLSESNKVITSGRKESSLILKNLGLNKTKVKRHFHSYSLPETFSNSCKPLDINKLRNKIVKWLRNNFRISKYVIDEIISLNTKKIDYRIPTIGIYGKVGESKGNYELLSALDIIAKKKIDFNFVSISGSNSTQLEKYYKAILETKFLPQKTWILPPIAPWRIPSFLKRCNIVCFLEHRFPISFHTPVVPREILTSGACLVCSKEIVEKQWFKINLVDGKNFVLIYDPKDIEYLSKRLLILLENKQLTYAIGKRGQFLSEFIENEYFHYYSIVDLYEDIIEELKCNI